MTVQAQGGYTVGQYNAIDSALYDPNPESRKSALARSNDQNVFRQVALNDKDPEIRKQAMLRLK